MITFSLLSFSNPTICISTYDIHIYTPLCYSHLRHSCGTWLPSECCHPPSPQSHIVPRCHAVLLLPSGTPAQENLKGPHTPVQDTRCSGVERRAAGPEFSSKALNSDAVNTTSTCSPGVTPYNAKTQAFVLI